MRFPAIALAFAVACSPAHAGAAPTGMVLAVADGEDSAASAAPAPPPKPGFSDAKRKAKEILAGEEFSPEETIHYPAFKNPSRPSEKKSSWVKSFEAFMRGVAEILRAGVWVFVGIGVIVLLLTLRYWWKLAQGRERPVAVDLPTRVGNLDIRAESLPDDVGAAALELWETGNAIGALSLLYRGALSALVLRFDAAIRVSSTEEECLRAAQRVLAVPPSGYFAALTRAWQSAVYAARRPDDATGRALCRDFAQYFGPRVEAAPLKDAA